jgi:hypothetical protein
VEAKCAQARAKSGNLSSDQQFEKNGETFPEAEKLMAAETEASKVDSKGEPNRFIFQAFQILDSKTFKTLFFSPQKT